MTASSPSSLFDTELEAAGHLIFFLFPHLSSCSLLLFFFLLVIKRHHVLSVFSPYVLHLKLLLVSVCACVIIYGLVNGERLNETQSLAFTLTLSATPKSPQSLAYFHINGLSMVFV